MRMINKHYGFTLMEMVIVMIIIAIIASASSKLLLQGVNAYYNSQNILLGYWQGNLAIQRFSRDVGMIRSSGDITTATSTNLVFTDINGDTVNYLLSGTSLTLNSNNLATDINLANSSFSYYDNNLNSTSTLTSICYIKIQLNINSSGTNFTIINTLFPRNL